MKECRNNKRAFGRIELLVVIVVVAIAAAALIPGLRYAKYAAKRTVCLNNVKSQYAVQMNYANDNDGNFAPHEDEYPFQVRNARTAVSGNNIYDLFKNKYLTDTSILLCPLLKDASPQGEGQYHTDLSFTNGHTGGWEAGVDPKLPFIAISYHWYANYWEGSWVYKFKFTSLDGVEVNEPAWPKNVAQCDSKRAFISHTTQRWENITKWNKQYLLDHGHPGQRDNPLGYADGHVVAVSKEQLKPRAQFDSKRPMGVGDIIY